MQLVEPEPPRVNERSTVVVRDNVENDDDDDDGGGEDEEEGGACFLSMGRNFLVAGYLHIIPWNSRMCLIRRYLSLAVVPSTPTGPAITSRRPPRNRFCLWRSLRSLASRYYWKPLDLRKKARAAGLSHQIYIDILRELILLRSN